MQLDAVLASLEAQQSYSRAGRLMEGRAAARHVSAFNQRPPAMPLDMSKVLSVAEVGGGDRGAEAMCSSARDHPSEALKNVYVTVSEKRNLFDASLETCVRPAYAAAAAGGGPSAVGGTPAATPARHHAHSSAASAASSPHRQQHDTSGASVGGVSPLRGGPSSLLVPKTSNTSAFLAIPRAKAQQPTAQNPPVGHYNPRYTAVDVAEPSTILPKQVRRRAGAAKDGGGHASRGAMTPEPAAVGNSSAAQQLPPRASSALDAPSTPVAQPLSPAKGATTDPNARPPQPTWPFRSRTVAHHDASSRAAHNHSPSPSSSSAHAVSIGGGPVHVPSAYNEALVTKRQPVLCDMGKSLGRREAPRTISVDLMYNPPIQKQIKVADVRLDRTTGRDGGGGGGGISAVPRVGRDVENAQSRLNTDNYAKFKYKKDAVIADFDKYPSKDVWINSSAAIKLSQTAVGTSELPASAGRTVFEQRDRTREVCFKKMVPRTDARMSDGYGLQYDVEEAPLHVPTVRLDRMPERRLAAAPASEASQVVYNPDVNKFKKKITQTISFASYPDREQRSLTGRATPAVFHETQAMLDTNVDALALPVTMRPVLKGDPRMATHASRAKRERALNPPTDTHDLMYSYSVDEHKAPLRKGAVGFDQMVSRDRHGGSAFANAMREMVRK